MKFFVIILSFCFLSVARSEVVLNPKNVLLAQLNRDLEDFYFTKTETIDCMKKFLNFTDEPVMEEKEIKKIKQELKRLLQNDERPPWLFRVEAAYDIGNLLCTDKKISFEYLQNENETSYDEHLDCLKEKLKELEPNNEIVKDYHGNSECKFELEMAEFHYLQWSSVYKNAQLSKCTLDEFAQMDFVKAYELEVVLMVKSLNLSLEEVAEVAYKRWEKISKVQLKCIWDELREN